MMIANVNWDIVLTTLLPIKARVNSIITTKFFLDTHIAI